MTDKLDLDVMTREVRASDVGQGCIGPYLSAKDVFALIDVARAALRVDSGPGAVCEACRTHVCGDDCAEADARLKLHNALNAAGLTSAPVSDEKPIACEHESAFIEGVKSLAEDGNELAEELAKAWRELFAARAEIEQLRKTRASIVAFLRGKKVMLSSPMQVLLGGLAAMVTKSDKPISLDMDAIADQIERGEDLRSARPLSETMGEIVNAQLEGLRLPELKILRLRFKDDPAQVAKIDAAIARREAESAK